MTKRRKIADPPWQPMRPAVAVPSTLKPHLRKLAGLDDAPPEMWMNHIYTVSVERAEGGWVTSLSIRRNDRDYPRDWRDFQRIKNEIAGPDVEAIELYPATERVVDTANQFWLWCLPPGQKVLAGFKVGERDDTHAPQFGARQRPFTDADEPPKVTSGWGEILFSEEEL